MSGYQSPKNWLRTGATWALALGILSGCATRTQTEQRFVDESERELETAGSTAGGAALGGVLAGGACALLSAAGGGSDRDVRQSAVTCGVLGAAVGGAHGYQKAKRKQNLEDQVIALNLLIDDIRKERADLESLNGSAQSLLLETRERLAQVKADVEAKRASLDELTQARNRAQDHAVTMQKVIDKKQQSKDELADAAQRGKGSAADRKKAEEEIALLEREIDQLKKTRDALLESAEAVAS